MNGGVSKSNKSNKTIIPKRSSHIKVVKKEIKKTEPAKKGFNSYVRKPKHGWLNTQYDLDIYYDI